MGSSAAHGSRLYITLDRLTCLAVPSGSHHMALRGPPEVRPRNTWRPRSHRPDPPGRRHGFNLTKVSVPLRWVGDLFFLDPLR